MNIGIVCYPTYGGSGVIATELAIELARRKHNVHLICHHRPVRLSKSYPSLTFHGAEVTPYPLFAYPFYTLSIASKIYEVIKEYNIEILHLHYAIPHTPSALLAKYMMNTSEDMPKIITTLHGTDINLLGFEPGYRALINFSLKMSNGITAVSRYLLELTKKEFELDESKAQVIYNFVDPEIFTPYTQSNDLKKLYSKNNEKIVTHISNFRKVKNTIDVIRIFKIIVSKLPARLLLIGHGPDIPYLENMVKEMGLSASIEFLGEINEVAPFLAISDLFILPSRTESFGLAALEAMSCKVPVVASNVGGLPEVIVNGVSGYIVNPGDVNTMAEYSLKILQDEKLQKKMGDAARQIACDKFSLKRIVSQYEDYYEFIMNHS